MTDYALQMAWGNFSAALMHVGGENVYYNVSRHPVVLEIVDLSVPPTCSSQRLFSQNPSRRYARDPTAALHPTPYEYLSYQGMDHRFSLLRHPPRRRGVWQDQPVPNSGHVKLHRYLPPGIRNLREWRTYPDGPFQLRQRSQRRQHLHGHDERFHLRPGVCTIPRRVIR